MNKISLYIPKLEDLWFREILLSDPKTMNYNAGYEVVYEGYHFDTGCIDFPKSVWQAWYERKIKNPNFFYAYIVVNNKFIGECNFNINPLTGKASMGIVIKKEYQGKGYMRPTLVLLIEEAKKRKVQVLTDSVPDSRERALKVFYELGFIKVGEFKNKKFNKNENIYNIELNINNI